MVHTQIKLFHIFHIFHIFIFHIYIYIYIYIYAVSHRSEYTPLIFVNILLYLLYDNTEELTLCYNVT